MYIKTVVLTAFASLVIATTAHAQIGWTLDQCKAKYGEPVKDNGDQSSQVQAVRACGKVYIFNATGLKLVAAFNHDTVAAIDYEPETAYTFKQAQVILTKNSNTTWKKDTKLSDGEVMNSFTTKGNLRANLYFSEKETLLSSEKATGSDSFDAIAIINESAKGNVESGSITDGPIDWTLDQCIAKYGQPEKFPDDFFPAGECCRFYVNGFYITININSGIVDGVIYEPRDHISREQGNQILAKNSSTNWKPGLIDGENMEDYTTKNGRNHSLSGCFYLSSYDVWKIVIWDDTILDPIRKQIEQTKKDETNKEEKQVQDNVNGL